MTVAEKTEEDVSMEQANSGADDGATMFTRWEIKIPVEPEDPFATYKSVFITVEGSVPLVHHTNAIKDEYGVDKIMEMKRLYAFFGSKHRSGDRRSCR